MLQVYIGSDVILDSDVLLDSDVILRGSKMLTSKDTICIEDAIDERSTLTCTIIDELNNYNFVKGTPIEVFNDDVLLFSGVIDKPTKRQIVYPNLMAHTLQCIDWHYLADKRIIAKAYENVLAGDIVRDIVTNILSQEGVTIGEIQDGATIVEAVFNYVKVSQALDILAEKAGFWYKIDQYKRLYFVARSTNHAPFSIINTEMEENSIAVEQGNPQYRNRQYVKGGKDITDPQTQVFKGDGANQVFTVGYPIAKVPTALLNGIAQTVGIRGLEENKQWYWSKGSNVISQENGAVPLESTDILAITYQGEFDIVVLSQNPESIQGRLTIEGTGTGWVEDVADETSASTRESAFEVANSKIQKYSIMGKKVKFRTLKVGIESGQLLPVTIPNHDLYGKELLVDSVTIDYIDELVWYTIQAVEGLTTGSWAKLFYNMATRGQAFVIRENISEDQMLVTIEQFNKIWLETEVPNIFKTLYPSATTYPVNNYPSFEYANRIKEMAVLGSGGVEILRKSITKQTGEEENIITSTVYINGFEANGDITALRWYGGTNNIIVDQQVFIKTKTDLEAIQVDKIDTKGW